MKLSRNNLILLFLILFGAGIRLWGLGNDGFHTDEEFTYNLVRHNLEYILTYTLTQDCNPPLFYLIDHFTLLILGATIWALRIPSVIFGTLLIPATYLLGRELEDEYTGLFAAVIVTTLGSMWYYSQFGRAYMLVALLFTITTLFFVRVLKNPVRNNFVGLIVFGTACMYGHLYAAIPLSFMWLYLLWSQWHRTLLFAFIFALCCLPLSVLGYSILTNRTTGSEIVGNTIPQLILVLPLEYFGYAFLIFFALIIYATLVDWKTRTVPVMVGIAVMTVIAQLAICNVTGVFARYSLLLVPVLVTVTMIPVSRFYRGNALPIQKWFAIGLLFAMYFIIQAFQALSQYYLPKG